VPASRPDYAWNCCSYPVLFRRGDDFLEPAGKRRHPLAQLGQGGGADDDPVTAASATQFFDIGGLADAKGSADRKIRADSRDLRLLSPKISGGSRPRAGLRPQGRVHETTAVGDDT